VVRTPLGLSSAHRAVQITFRHSSYALLAPGASRPPLLAGMKRCMRIAGVIAGLALVSCVSSSTSVRSHEAFTAHPRRCRPSLERPSLRGQFGCIRGMIVDAQTGEELGDATVIASLPGGDNVFTTFSGDDGTYSIQLPVGTYTIHAYTADGEVSRRHVEVKPNQSTSLTVRVPKARGETLLLPPPVRDAS
jgi:hypothetical protein